MENSFILLKFDTSNGHMVYFLVILVHFSRFGKLHQAKSGNPADTGTIQWQYHRKVLMVVNVYDCFRRR
jgi:hypothetical protein